MSDNPINPQATVPEHIGAPALPEERKNLLHFPGLTSSLKPGLLDEIHISYSARQNYALAAEAIFVHALNRTVWSYRAVYPAVDMFLTKIRDLAMESLATEPGVVNATNLVFYSDDGAMREFLFTLQAQFFSQFGELNQNWVEFIDNIAASLTGGQITGVEIDPSLVRIPEDLTNRMFTRENMKKILLANNWLIMLVLISLWARTYTYDELRAVNRRK